MIDDGVDPAWLDPRAWLVWGMAASLPPLLGRNPFVLVATLLVALAVRSVWAPITPGMTSWRGLLRLALVFATVGVVFNVFTAHSGDLVFARLPDALPIVGGPLTINALVFGVLSGLALVSLVLVGATLGAVLDWATLLRLVPARLAPIAVAGSVAFAFIPQMIAALREIREAQAARGYRPRGVRDVVPLLVPLLTGGLERALTLAEALEARGFGAPLGPATKMHSWRPLLTAMGLATAASAAFAVASGHLLVGLIALVAAIIALMVAGREPGYDRLRRTRYRVIRWSRSDTVVTVASGLAGVVSVMVLAADPVALRWEPYPSLSVPAVNLAVLAAQGGLLAPVIVAGRMPNTVAPTSIDEAETT